MKKYLLIFILFVSCTPKLSTSTISSFAKVRRALANTSNSYGAISLRAYHPDYIIINEPIAKQEANSQLRKKAFQLSEGQISAVTANKDGSCGIIKVFSKEHYTRMRVRYIYSKDKTEKGEEFADQMILAYKNGADFAELARKHSRDGNAANGGDLGWFRSTDMVEDFSQAILAHKKGDVYKAYTKQFGWYVIYNTHETIEGDFVNVIEVIQPKCK